MIATATFNKEKMYKAIEEGFLNATDLADYLVSLGLPFRTAHEVSGKSVKLAEKEGVTLGDISLEIYQQLLNECADTDIQLTEALYHSIDPMASVNRKLSPGSTAVSEVTKMIQIMKAQI